MTKTALLQINEIAPTQTGKSITVNAAIAALEEAGNAVFENLTVGGSGITIAEADYLRHAIFVFDGLSADVTVTFPDQVGTPPGDTERVFCVRNIDTAQTLTVRGVGTGTTVVLPPNSVALLYKDAVNVVALSITTPVTSAQPYDIGFFVAGTPSASDVVARILVARACSFPINFAGSFGVVSGNPSSTDTYDITKNGTSIGSMAISTAGAVTFTVASAQTFAAGDYIEFVAPATPTHVDLSVTVRGTRTGA